jgi:hypothetical protein
MNTDTVDLVQWQAWLRHTRPTSPTIQEIIAADKRRLMIQERARQLDDDWAKVWKMGLHFLRQILYLTDVVFSFDSAS